MLDQHLPGLVVRSLDQPAHLAVDDGGHGLGVVALVAHVAAEEHLPRRAAELDGADLLAHAELRDHLAGQAGRLLDVVRGPGGGVVEHELLRDAPAEQVGELVEHLVARGGVLVLGGQHHRVAEGPPARQDRDLGDRVGVGQRRRHQGVTTLVVGRDEAFLVVHQAGALLRPGHHPVDGLVEGDVVDALLVGAGGEQGRLVEHVGQVGAGEAGGPAGDRLQVDVVSHGLALAVHLQDLQPTLHVGGLDGDLTVEAAGAQQRGVEDVGPVGGGDEDDVGLDVEAVHLHQQLVEGLLALVVPAAHTRPAVPADRVDLVDEDDRGGVLLGLLEQVAHAGGADADEHLDEVRTGDRVERHPRLAGRGARQQGLAGPGGAVQEDALGDLRPDREELLRLGQELLDLGELLDGLVGAGHVGEGDLGHVLGDELGLGLAELHDAVAAAAHAGQHEPEQPEDEQQGQHGEQQAGQDRGLRVGLVHPVGGRVPVQQAQDVLAPLVDVVGADLGRAVHFFALHEGEVEPLLPVHDERGFDLLVLDELESLARVHRGEPVGRDEAGPDQHDHDRQDDPDRPAP